jgi:hypothetical protein
VLAVGTVGGAGAARAVDHQASEERAGQDGDEELERPDGAAAGQLDHVTGQGSKAGYLRGQGPGPDPDAVLPLVGLVADDRAQGGLNPEASGRWRAARSTTQIIMVTS